jgi:hypothetical protein
MDDAVRSRIMAVRAALSSHAWTRQAIETRERATPRVLAHMDALMADMFEGDCRRISCITPCMR